MKNSHRQRNQLGQGIVEGTIALCLICASLTLGLILILNAGIGMYSKEKLERVCQLATQYAAQHAAEENVADETKSYVTTLMSEIGMTPNNLSVNIATVNIQSQQMLKVTVSNNFQLCNTGNLMPAQLTLADTDCVVW